jgi:hypothetical protein
MSPPNLGEIQPANIRCRGLRHSGTSNEAASRRFFACVEALPPDQVRAAMAARFASVPAQGRFFS